MNFDFSAMAKSLQENIKQFGGFSPEVIRRSGLVNEEALRFRILTALHESSKTGHEVVEALANANLKHSAANVYPLLESLLDEGFVAVAVKKDRKFYSLTDSGIAWLSSAPAPEEGVDENAENLWAPKWVDVRGVVPVAGARLAKVSLEVAKYGTKEQQERAAEAIDEARRQIHQILSEQPS